MVLINKKTDVGWCGCGGGGGGDGGRVGDGATAGHRILRGDTHVTASGAQDATDDERSGAHGPADRWRATTTPTAA